MNQMYLVLWNYCFFSNFDLLLPNVMIDNSMEHFVGLHQLRKIFVYVNGSNHHRLILIVVRPEDAQLWCAEQPGGHSVLVWELPRAMRCFYRGEPTQLKFAETIEIGLFEIG